MDFFSEFWFGLADGSAEFIPAEFGSAAIDGLVRLPAYILGTLGGGADLFDS